MLRQSNGVVFLHGRTDKCGTRRDCHSIGIRRERIPATEGRIRASQLRVFGGRQR